MYTCVSTCRFTSHQFHGETRFSTVVTEQVSVSIPPTILSPEYIISTSGEGSSLHEPPLVITYPNYLSRASSFLRVASCGRAELLIPRAHSHLVLVPRPRAPLEKREARPGAVACNLRPQNADTHIIAERISARQYK